MANNTENPLAEEPERDAAAGSEKQPEEAPSLRGQGWDILVGGEEHAALMGGSDPFDMYTPDDAEADAVLTGGAGRQPTSAGDEPPPEEIFWDRGRGAEAAEPSPVEGEAEPPPRDLSPEELGRIPTQPQPTAGGVPPAPIEVPPLAWEEMLTPPRRTTAPSAPTREETIPFGEMAGGAAPTVVPEAPAYAVERARIYDPFERVIPTPAPPAPELEASKDLTEKLITQERLDALWNEINETYNLAISSVRGDFHTTESALADLKKAREMLLAGLENFDNAEELVKRVKARLRLEEKVRQWSRTRGTWLGIYLVVWLLLLSTLSLLTNRIDTIAQQFVPAWLAAAFLPGLFGGLGGVVGALWVLIKHIARERDFDPLHTPWYVTNPFLGFALGVITYLLLRASSGLLGADPQVLEGTAPGLYALCVIVGFNQNVLWALVDRVIKAILPAEEITPATEEWEEASSRSE